jgi:hypothetical protein
MSHDVDVKMHQIERQKRFEGVRRSRATRLQIGLPAAAIAQPRLLRSRRLVLRKAVSLAGDKLAEEIRRLKPDIRVRFTSGYASPQVAGNRLAKNEIWLKKPYGPGACDQASRIAGLTIEATLRLGRNIPLFPTRAINPASSDNAIIGS